MWRSQSYSTSSESMLSSEKVQTRMEPKSCLSYVGRCLGDCAISKSKSHYPLTAVRPDYTAYSPRFTPVSSIPQAPSLPYSRRTPPHFMEADNPEKYFKTGYAGNRFFTYPQFGHTSKVDSYHALCDFTNGYQFTKSSEFAPLPFYHASLDGERPGTEIFPRNTGLMPSYKGHVPGMKHSYGKTFGTESVNAKRYLQNSSICSH